MEPQTWPHLNVHPWISPGSEADAERLREVGVLHVHLDALGRARKARAVRVDQADRILVRGVARQALSLVHRPVVDAGEACARHADRGVQPETALAARAVVRRIARDLLRAAVAYARR